MSHQILRIVVPLLTGLLLVQKSECSSEIHLEGAKSLARSDIGKFKLEAGRGRGGEVEEEDMANMVAAMRSDTSAGFGQIEELHSDKSGLDWRLDLDAAGGYQLSWRASVAENSIEFSLRIHATKANFRPGRDIFALGFSERGALESGDFCIIWYDLGHRMHLQDARTNARGQLELIDGSESVCAPVRRGREKGQLEEAAMVSEGRLSGLSGPEGDQSENNEESDSSGVHQFVSEENGTLVVSFKRPLEVCQKLDHFNTDQRYYKIDNGTTHLLWLALRGPLLALDGLNLTQLALSKRTRAHTTAANTSVEPSSGQFGMHRVQLIATKSRSHKRAHARQTTRWLDVRMEAFAIPAKETTYMCKIFKLPRKFEQRQYHITSYEATIEQGNEHVVHHMELFNCANLSAQDRRELEAAHTNGTDWAGECSSAARPSYTNSCKRVILAWAMGARPLIYPEQVGQPIGGASYSPYVMLELHYNNVAQSSGLVDSSGLRFHYSPRLRPFDAGVLEVGLEYTDKNSIPPGLITPLAGYCVSECTRTAMSARDDDNSEPECRPRHKRPRAGRKRAIGARQQPSSWVSKENFAMFHQDDGSTEIVDAERAVGGDGDGDGDGDRCGGEREEKGGGGDVRIEGGIHIFAAQMHTHLAGISSWTEHVRGGLLLDELQRDDHYSPHFQEIRLLAEPVHVAPGDALIHYCLYDTRSRVNVTLGGFATSDEMCVTYLHYYPKIDLEVCKSSVDTSALSEYFERLAKDEGQRSSGASINEPTRSKSVSENYRSIDWSARRSRELIEFYNRAPLSVQCKRSDGRSWPGHWDGIEPARISRRHANDSWRLGCELERAHQLVQYRGSIKRAGHCSRQPYGSLLW